MDTMKLTQEARRVTRLSQSGFGKLLGVNRSRVSKWELGLAKPTSPTRRLLELILADPGTVIPLLERIAASDGEDQTTGPEPGH